MASPGAAYPAPGAKLHAELVEWTAGRAIHRIHDKKYASTQFNASGLGNTRFSPIAGAAILYGQLLELAQRIGVNIV